MSDEQYTIADVMTQLQEFDPLLRLLIRQKMSNKFEKLYEEIKSRGRMDTPQVMQFLNISRPHALPLMKKAGDHPGFRFNLGHQEFKQPAKIIYDASKTYQDQLNKLKGMIDEKGKVTYGEIMQVFDTDLNDARTLANNLIDIDKTYEIIDGNKIGRVSSQLSNL